MANKPHIHTTEWPKGLPDAPGTASRDSSKLTGAFHLLKIKQQSKLDSKTRFRLPDGNRESLLKDRVHRDNASTPAHEALIAALNRDMSPTPEYPCRHCQLLPCQCHEIARHAATLKLLEQENQRIPHPAVTVKPRYARGFEPTE